MWGGGYWSASIDELLRSVEMVVVRKRPAPHHVFQPWLIAPYGSARTSCSCATSPARTCTTSWCRSSWAVGCQ